MDEQPDRDVQPPIDARRRARELFERTAPVLRDVNARIDQHAELRRQRDKLVDRASELVQKADDALGKVTAIEGTVVERPAAGASATPAVPSEPAPRTTPPTTDSSVRPAPGREPHWTRERLARMATAAATEAVRPHRPLLTQRAKLGIGAALAALLALVLLRRR